MEEMPVKSHASQGQQKSFAIALKLAQFELLAAKQQHKPLLLLDDIFDRLDDKRIARLLELVAIEPTSIPLLVKVLPATLNTKLAKFNVPAFIVTFPEAVVVPKRLFNTGI